VLRELPLMEAQQKVHELISQQAPLPVTLDTIARWIETMLPGAAVAFMAFDADTMTLSLQPSERFSPDYRELLQAVRIGPDAGSFGRAAYLQEMVVSEDIAEDPLWASFRNEALTEGLRACWSSPVLTSGGELLGTFGVYFKAPCHPTDDQRRWLKQASALITLAMVRDRDSKSHRALAEWHRSLFVNHPDGVYEFDLEGRFQRGNAALERITGYAESELLGRHFNDFIDPAYHALTQAGFDAARAGGSRQYETRGRHHSGHAYDLEILNFPVSLDGEVVGVYGVCRDVTERKRQEEALRLLERGVEASPNGIIMADALAPDMPLVYANEAFTSLTGYQRHEVLGQNCRFLQGEATSEASVSKIREALAAKEGAEVTLINYRKDGMPFWNHLSLSPVFDSRGRCTHFIGIQEDVTHQREQQVQIAYQAAHDPLTGLPNRTAFKTQVAGALADAGGLAVVMHVDLDGFRAVNEGLGHAVGNRLLVAVARRLEALCQSGDVSVARLVSDEFALLLPAPRDTREAEVVADNLLDSLAQPFEIDGKPLHVSASIGLARSSGDVGHPHHFLQRAELAMAAAKAQGRNAWQWYRPSVERASESQVLLRHDIYVALRDEQFHLHYQPVVDASSGRICGMEALVRWHHPVHGVMSPGEFIPLAEKTGQIIPLGRWVLQQACREAEALRQSTGRSIPVAVNISSPQFGRDGFLADVEQALSSSGLPGELLELEVTESVMLAGVELVVSIIEQLGAFGVRVALDDFGTGFSSLEYLRDLPIHKIKLDRGFTQDAASNESNAAIIDGVVLMAHRMGLCIVAEGIEDAEQGWDMAQRGCDLLQGYYFSRPVPADDIATLSDSLPEDSR